MTKKQFHIGDILSVRGERLLRSMDGVYKLCNFLTGDNLFTHQLIRAHEPCRQALINQFPDLADYDDSTVNHENFEAWLAVQVKKYGEYRDVEPMPKGEWRYKDPVSEAVELVGQDKVVVIKS